MKVKCVINNVHDISYEATRRRLSQTILSSGPISDLLLNHVYVVVALGIWDDGGIRVYIHNVKQSEFPYPFPIEFFEVVDSQIPEDWQIGSCTNSQGRSLHILSFRQWAIDPTFYERLVNGEANTVEMYIDYLGKLNGESSQEGLKEVR